MKRRGVKETDPYDWEKLEGGVHSVSNMSSQNNMPSNIQSHIQVKTDQIHGGACMNSTGVIGVIATGNATTIGATNASGIEYVSKSETFCFFFLFYFLCIKNTISIALLPVILNVCADAGRQKLQCYGHCAK